MRIFERPPLRLIGEVEMPGGLFQRWAEDDDDPGDIPGNLTFSTTMPGGFETGATSLPRTIARNYSDVGEFITVRWKGVGGQIAYEGRIQSSPRDVSDQQTISPEIVGWQAHLDDDSSAREIYIDTDFNQWQPQSLQKKINDAPTMDYEDATVGPDPGPATSPGSGLPALITQLSGPWSRHRTCRAMYDSRGIPIGSIGFAWNRKEPVGSTLVDPSNTNWTWNLWVSDDDVNFTNIEASANQRVAFGAGPGTGTLTSGSQYQHMFAFVQLDYGTSGGTSSTYGINWTNLSVMGTSGIPIQGAVSAVGGLGVLASDVIMNALSRWAPKIGFSTGVLGTITPTSFSIPQCAFPDPTTVSNIISEVIKFDLQDWAVWEGPTFFLQPWGSGGRFWQSRVREAQLQDAGPSVDRSYNGVVVTYTDALGIARSVGPPGSSCQYTDSSLFDPDPMNPCNLAGIVRNSPPFSLGTADIFTAIATGARYLQELKQKSTAGSASLVGYIEDSTTGLEWPAWMVRAGDWISFLDAANTDFRRITRTSYDDATKTNALTLDAPPDDMQALLERTNVRLLRAGL